LSKEIRVTEPEGPAAAAEVAETNLDGTSEAEGEIVRRFQERVFLIAYVRTGDREAARDLAQETMLAVIRSLRKGRLLDREKLPGYICGTAQNLINNHLRTRSRKPESGPPPEELPAPDCQVAVEQSERLFLARRAIARLQPADRLILLLTLVDGLKPGEIAVRLGLSSEVVRKRKSRALERVREVLGMGSRR
jgi:RNA polymerase sigma-70 factor (ECF subfamily)